MGQVGAWGLIVLCLGGLAGPPAWHRVRGAAVEAQLRPVGEEWEVQLSAPTGGWLLVGFNDRPGLQGATLVFARVVGGVGQAEVHRTDLTLPPPHHRRVEAAVRVDSAAQGGGTTRVRLRVPRSVVPPTATWLILAHSESDDFNHHSRAREHLPWRP